MGTDLEIESLNNKQYRTGFFENALEKLSLVLREVLKHVQINIENCKRSNLNADTTVINETT